MSACLKNSSCWCSNGTCIYQYDPNYKTQAKQWLLECISYPAKAKAERLRKRMVRGIISFFGMLWAFLKFYLTLWSAGKHYICLLWQCFKKLSHSFGENLLRTFVRVHLQHKNIPPLFLSSKRWYFWEHFYGKLQGMYLIVLILLLIYFCFLVLKKIKSNHFFY